MGFSDGDGSASEGDGKDSGWVWKTVERSKDYLGGLQMSLR